MLEADPIFALGSIIWLLAVGVWPVAIMLGSSCSPCCTKVKVCRCVRYEQQTHDSTPTSGTITAVTHGWSAVANTPGGAGIEVLQSSSWIAETSSDAANGRQWRWKPPYGNNFVTDSERVHKFWLGTETLSYVNSSNKTILAKTEDWNEACGQSICAGSSYINQEPYKLFHQQHPKRNAVATLVSSDSNCSGQSGTSVTAPMRLVSCSYLTNWATCAINTSFSKALDLFYCGDLLWAVENGPCRSSITFNQTNISYGANLQTVSLTENWSDVAGNRSACFNLSALPDGDGTCPPLEAVVSINDPINVGKYPETIYGDRTIIGTLSGDYVCSLSTSSCSGRRYDSGPIPFFAPGETTSRSLIFFPLQVRQSPGATCLPWELYSIGYEPYGGAAVITGIEAIQKLKSSPVTFSANTQPLEKTLTASASQISSEGQTIVYTYCCDNVIANNKIVTQSTPQQTVFSNAYQANNTLASIFWSVWKSGAVIELEQPPRGCVFQSWKLVSANQVNDLPSGYSASGDTITVPFGTQQNGVNVEISVQRFITSPLSPACALQPISNNTWITTSIYMPGVINQGYIRLTIAPNSTGQQRTGTVTVPCGTSGASTWTVIQQPQ